MGFAQDVKVSPALSLLFRSLFLQLIASREITPPRTAMDSLLAQLAPPAFSETTASAQSPRPLLTAGRALQLHWPEYLMEAAGLGFFMISACLFGALYENPASPVRQAIASTLWRRILMGISMGLTSLAIVYSPWGKQSGAHINPSVTLTFFRLGKIAKWDAIFYAVAQFTGAVMGVVLVAAFFGKAISHPAVRYVVTVPGQTGIAAALLAEFVIAFLLMSVILHASNHHRFSRFTGLFAAALVATYITLEAPFSGMSMNPARSFGSAFSAEIFSGLWIYFTAPPLGMLCAAELYLWWKGKFAIKCCKLHHDNDKRCIFCGANGGFAS
jgi:aquaporin Z